MRAGAVDAWAAWLLERRHGGDEAVLRATLERLAPVRDRVLDNGAIQPGETVLDVGCGDGLIAFGALERVGERGTVIFSDVSADLLGHARELAERAGVTERCRFVQATAESLEGIADGSVDIVATRSVLAYVADKAAAFRAFARVLRPGGRFTIYEPVNRHLYPEPPGRLFGYDVEAVRELAERVSAAYERRQRPDASDPMFDYDERDLMRYAAEAGFEERTLELRIAVGRQGPQTWASFANAAPNPKLPTLAEALAEALTEAERERFVAHLRPRVEAGGGEAKTAVAYLWGRRG